MTGLDLIRAQRDKLQAEHREQQAKARAIRAARSGNWNHPSISLDDAAIPAAPCTSQSRAVEDDRAEKSIRAAVNQLIKERKPITLYSLRGHGAKGGDRRIVEMAAQLLAELNPEYLRPKVKRPRPTVPNPRRRSRAWVREYKLAWQRITSPAKTRQASQQGVQKASHEAVDENPIQTSA